MKHLYTQGFAKSECHETWLTCLWIQFEKRIWITVMENNELSIIANVPSCLDKDSAKAIFWRSVECRSFGLYSLSFNVASECNGFPAAGNSFAIAPRYFPFGGGRETQKNLDYYFPSLHFFLHWGLLMCLPFVIMPPPLPPVEMVAYWLLPSTRLKMRKKGMRNWVEFITFCFGFAPYFHSIIDICSLWWVEGTHMLGQSLTFGQLILLTVWQCHVRLSVN